MGLSLDSGIFQCTRSTRWPAGRPDTQVYLNQQIPGQISTSAVFSVSGRPRTLNFGFEGKSRLYTRIPIWFIKYLRLILILKSNVISKNINLRVPTPIMFIKD